MKLLSAARLTRCLGRRLVHLLHNSQILDQRITRATHFHRIELLLPVPTAVTHDDRDRKILSPASSCVANHAAVASGYLIEPGHRLDFRLLAR